MQGGGIETGSIAEYMKPEQYKIKKKESVYPRHIEPAITKFHRQVVIEKSKAETK